MYILLVFTQKKKQLLEKKIVERKMKLLKSISQDFQVVSK